MNLIEKLKNNQKAFMFNTPEEIKVLKEVNEKGAVQWLEISKGQWNDNYMTKMFPGHVHRIKPDYQPEPEYVDLEIFIFDNELCIDIGQRGIHDHFVAIDRLVSKPRFHCFWEDKGEGFLLKNAFLVLSHISSKIHEGKKVVARFRK